MANLVVDEIDEDETGLVVQINDQSNLHAALALPSSPVVQGADANASLEAFRDWLIHGARNVNARSQVPENSSVSLAFHHLTGPEAVDMTSGQWLKYQWCTEIRNNGLLEFATVFWMDGTERRRATITIFQNIFALIIESKRKSHDLVSLRFLLFFFIASRKIPFVVKQWLDVYIARRVRNPLQHAPVVLFSWHPITFAVAYLLTTPSALLAMGERSGESNHGKRWAL
ncbi:hypothetical protein AeMF1_020784 [Aphanomyces euteiches]|nr:hypothetical protein AeMF1_020784 [Aphanomyces euteiches]KAH9187810.1 hypothetical protein AeNC1_010215 [Aphanomyces euteiches]